MNEDAIAAEVKAALDEVYRPAGRLLEASMARIRAPKQAPGWSLAAAAAVGFVVIASVALFATIKPHLPVGPATINGLPQPSAQPVSETASAAQVAWLSTQSQGTLPHLIGVDTNGKVIGHIASDSYGDAWRSADGSLIVVPGTKDLTAYSALTGQVARVYPRLAGGIMTTAFSPDGRWLALIVASSGRTLQVIDLTSGGSQTAAVPVTGTGGSLVVFTPDSGRLFVLADWGGPAGVYAFSLSGGSLRMTSSAVDGRSGHQFARCDGPAVANEVVRGATLVLFCHSNGVVAFIDLASLNGAGTVQAHQPNPFWLSPIFTPDGRLLYLHQWPSFGDTMQVLDLKTRKLVGPVATPTDVTPGGLFGSLITSAYAGGVASTVPMAPDGLTMYSAGPKGVMVMRVPDLKVVARLAPNVVCDEVWVSGDGGTLYVTSANTKLLVIKADGSGLRTVALPEPANGFLASKHG